MGLNTLPIYKIDSNLIISTAVEYDATIINGWPSGNETKREIVRKPLKNQNLDFKRLQKNNYIHFI